jgi:hypothetical protein
MSTTREEDIETALLAQLADVDTDDSHDSEDTGGDS